MSEAAPNNLTLSVLSGPSAGESYALEGVVGHVIMGSGETAHIQFESPVVAANHVRIAIDEQGAAVAPASPDAAVFLNDDPVTDDIQLKNGDILWMGNPGDEGAVMIQCHLEPAGATSVIPAAQPRWRDAPGYMDAMHELCITCHAQRAQQEPERFGDLLDRCDACHNADNEWLLRRLTPARTSNHDALQARSGGSRKP